MTLKDGRCPNCGSLLSLNEKAEKGHCLFCDAVFDNSRAFEIAADPEGVEFPNEEQPKYEGPNLDPQLNVPTGVKVPASKPAKKTSSRRAPEKKEAYVHKEPIKLPEIKLTPKKRIQVALVFVIILAIIAGIGVPTVMKRDNDRTAIVNSFVQKIEHQLNPDNSVAIRYTANNYAIIVLPENIDQDEAINIFQTYCNVRAEVRNETTAGFDKIYGRVSMKIMMPEGGYMFERPENEAQITAGTNIKKLS